MLILSELYIHIPGQIKAEKNGSQQNNYLSKSPYTFSTQEILIL